MTDSGGGGIRLNGLWSPFGIETLPMHFAQSREMVSEQPLVSVVMHEVCLHQQSHYRGLFLWRVRKRRAFKRLAHFSGVQ